MRACVCKLVEDGKVRYLGILMKQMNESSKMHA